MPVIIKNNPEVLSWAAFDWSDEYVANVTGFPSMPPYLRQYNLRPMYKPVVILQMRLFI